MSRVRLLIGVAFVAGCGGDAGSVSPAVDSISPNFGPLSGGSHVTITGSGFLVGGAPPNHVVFGDVEAPLAAADTDTTLEVTVPPGEKSGDVPIIVFNRNGEVTVMGQFHYSDALAQRPKEQHAS